MAKTRKKRQVYTPQQRAEILAAASRHSYTAAQVKRKFGVTPVTYYSWRKKTGAVAKRGRGSSRISAKGGSDLTSQLRTEVRAKIQAVLPGIVKNEVASYVDALFGAGRGRRKV